MKIWLVCMLSPLPERDPGHAGAPPAPEASLVRGPPGGKGDGLSTDAYAGGDRIGVPRSVSSHAARCSPRQQVRAATVGGAAAPPRGAATGPRPAWSPTLARASHQRGRRSILSLSPG